jgi:hypothetical protein
MNYKNLPSLIVIVFLIAFCSFNSAAQTSAKVSNTEERNGLLNTPFPKLLAKTLAGKEINFPSDTKDKPTILCIVFKDETQYMADGWTKEIIAHYSDSVINYFEVPMLKNELKVMRKVIDGGMRKGIDKNLHDNVATFYGKLKPYLQKLLMTNQMSCYIFLIDKSQTIQLAIEGIANADKLNELYSTINKINQ